MSHRPVQPAGHRRSGSAVVGRASAVSVAVALVALLITPVVAPGASAGEPAPTAEAEAALAWIADELDANGGSLPGFSPGSSDWGITADAVLAFVAAGRADEPAAVAATDLLANNATAYTTWAPVMPEVRVAGATAKVLLVLRSMDRSPVADGVDLDEALRASVQADGPQAGRIADQVPDPAWDASNAFGQSLGVLALTMGEGAPASTIDFLLAQQCPSGGFRLTFAGAGCGNDDEADTDATALSLMALLAQDRTQQVTAALEDGIGWLLGRQAADGSFGGTGPTTGANTNSSGLIAQLLRAAGQAEAADRAAGWIAATSQLTNANAAGTPASGDVGAIAYNPAALAVALEDGITEQTADQWRRASTQAVLAFGLAPYGPQDVEPLPPVTAPPTTAPPTTAPPTTAPPTTAPPTTAPPTTPAPPGTTPQTDPGTPSVPGPDGPAAAAPPVEADQPGVVLDASASPGGPTGGPVASAVGGAGGPAALATTGGDGLTPALAGSLLLLLGLVLLAGSMRRARR